MSKINAVIVRIAETHNDMRVGTCYIDHLTELDFVRAKDGRQFYRNRNTGNIVEVVAELGHADENEINLYSRLFELGRSYPDADEAFLKRIADIDLTELGQFALSIFRKGQEYPHNADIRL